MSNDSDMTHNKNVLADGVSIRISESGERPTESVEGTGKGVETSALPGLTIDNSPQRGRYAVETISRVGGMVPMTG